MIKDKLKQLVKLYKSGLTLQQIGDKFGCSRQYIYDILKGHVRFRKRYVRYKLAPLKSKFLQLVRENKWTKQELAKLFGVAICTITKTLKRLGVKHYNVKRYKIDMDILVRLYKKGWSIKEICLRTGYKCPRSIFYHLHRLGIKLRRHK